ncbi:MAG TPA: hypothetical protein VHG33_03100 [Woeseiaceae bacterium]|nr:hypothetical protein [Woeseiaceae bacterium]
MSRWLLLLLVAGPASAYDSGRAAFSVRVDDLVIPYRTFAVFVLPAEQFDIEVIGSGAPAVLYTSAGKATAVSERNWLATAPSRPGAYAITIRRGQDRMQLNVVVMHPSSKVVNGRLNGFRIGAYPARALNGDPIYLPPDGFIDLNAKTAALALSPHFALSQFPSKQPGGYPKYLVLQERLLLKLELLLEQVNARGFPADTLTIMSGYRTPWYNETIKNVPYSRHVYGGAADVFVDIVAPDGIMDDLNRDGRTDHRDAQTLYAWAHGLYGRHEHRRLRGGLGVYDATPAHGPFLHIDARGKRARWGLLP